jgi:ABC-type phosphate/phosphonate transport system substrate-binding protein
MLAVAQREADIAAIDCVTYAHLEKIDPVSTEKLRVIAETESTLTLPFITSHLTDDGTINAVRSALQSVIRDAQNAEIMSILMLDGVEILDASVYDRVRDIENQAIMLGYPTLA